VLMEYKARMDKEVLYHNLKTQLFRGARMMAVEPGRVFRKIASM